jgi:hypothetical protein
MGRLLRTIVFATVAILVARSTASATTITFETLSDGDAVTNQFSGVHFTDATVLSAGISLNELEFPPHSGNNVVFDDGGPITIVFDSVLTLFQGYVTYGVSLTANAYDTSHAVLGSYTSLFSNNEALSGDPSSSPNELVSFSSLTGISSVTITGDPGGGSFVLDDVTFSLLPAPGPAVPEPGTLSLLMTGIALGVRDRKRRAAGHPRRWLAVSVRPSKAS